MSTGWQTSAGKSQDSEENSVHTEQRTQKLYEESELVTQFNDLQHLDEKIMKK